DHGTGTAARLGRPVAGKTGTTENSQDAWFIGYTPQLSTAVWVGHPEGAIPMTDVHGITVTGGTFPARIFSAYMKAALAGKPPLPLFTASPDELDLHPLGPPALGPPPIGGSTTPVSTSTTEPRSTTRPSSTTSSTTTTTGHGRTTTTTTPPTTTTAAPP